MIEALGHIKNKVARKAFKVAIPGYYAFHGLFSLYNYDDLSSRDLDELEESVKSLQIDLENVDLGDQNY
jgi:hypothetical protein